MPPRRYDPVTQSLHWIIALAVILAYLTAVGRETFPKGDFRTWLRDFHMSLGVLVLALSCLRLGWRVFNPVPRPVSENRMAALAAKAAHIALYAAMIAIPLNGLLAAWARGRGVDFFGLFPIPSPIGVADRALSKQLGGFHEITGNLMMALAGLHAAAAIVHQFVLKDGTLARMLPYGSDKPDVAS